MDKQREKRIGEEGPGQGSKPIREAYDWPSVALFVIFLGAFVYALLRR
jgi:hypothetical protein